MSRAFLTLAAAGLLSAAACSNVGEPPLPGDGDAAYYPNGDGSRWAYRYQRYFNNVPYGDAYDYDDAFDGTAEVGGREVQRLVRKPRGSKDYELFFVGDDDANYVLTYGRELYKEGRMLTGAYYEPPWTALVYPLAVNRTWSEVKQEGLSPAALALPEDLDNDGRLDMVDIEVVSTVVTREDLTLPAGTFEDCYKIRRTIYASFHMTAGGDVEAAYVQYYWFKPYRGYIQISGDEVTVPNAARYTFLSQLTSYDLKAAAPPA